MSDPKRVYNFNPGPAALPLEVLQQAQAEMTDYKGTGMSVMEISHRSKEFESIIQTAEADLRELLGIPANYKVLFLQGGASLQFAMLPMNLRTSGSADYIVTGTWSKTAFKEAQKLGATHAAANTEADGFKSLPAKLDLDPKAAYLHFTSNETIHGVEFFKEPLPPAGVPLEQRLEKIFGETKELLTRHQPSATAVESLFFNANVRTALAVGQARGVTLLACSLAGCSVFEYTPQQIKQAVVGYGKAEKSQVMEMVRVLLGLAELPRPDHAADALGVAICHANTCGVRERVEKALSRSARGAVTP